MIHFFNEWHLGDCLRQLHWQRHLTGPSTLWCHGKYHDALIPFCYGSTVQLGELDQRPGDAIDSWIGQNQLHTRWHWEEDFGAFYIRFWDYLAQRAGVSNPFWLPEHIRLDGPAIHRGVNPYGKIDVLLVNSTPLSYQWDENLTPVHLLTGCLKGKVVTTAHVPPQLVDFPRHCTLDGAPRMVDVAAVARDARYVIGIDTGPMVPTYNVYSKARHIVMHNAVSFKSFPDTISVKNYGELIDAIKREKLLI